MKYTVDLRQIHWIIQTNALWEQDGIPTMTVTLHLPECNDTNECECPVRPFTQEETIEFLDRELAHVTTENYDDSYYAGLADIRNILVPTNGMNDLETLRRLIIGTNAPLQGENVFIPANTWLSINQVIDRITNDID